MLQLQKFNVKIFNKTQDNGKVFTFVLMVLLSKDLHFLYNCYLFRYQVTSLYIITFINNSFLSSNNGYNLLLRNTILHEPQTPRYPVSVDPSLEGTYLTNRSIRATRNDHVNIPPDSCQVAGTELTI